ncbi:sialate O-acetylesterase [Chitinophaga sp. SYP-B3965]|uniref:sialate O-acetylesterase n=1 Tax=Chitinophaga sp. SYP-B3965 TaxID=2663120 RepID=UPI001299E359|nr:sialate O-acetylesterase [Chitinophaga sp. SYP-B3965]MRG44113.1 sialate O-acetylesterase [Chitinophaga sp. SYP-B3965]
MKKNIAFIIIAMLSGNTLFAQQKQFHLYLLAGQSNMAGRGIVEPQDTIGDPRILCLNKEGNWVIAKDPIHFDKSAAGVGPGLSFAREMIKQDPNIVIGLIPCAAGGSGIDNWLYNQYWEQTKSYPWADAVARTERAMKDGILKGILWHQGESDSSPEKAAQYSNKLDELVNKFRKEFNLPNLPFIAGELPEFNKRASAINLQLQEAKKRLSHFEIISGKGLTPNADGLHIDAASQRIFGKRYAEKIIHQ